MAIEIKDIDGGIGNIIIARGVVTGQEYVDTHKKHLTQDKKKLNNSFIVVIQLFLSALLLFHINCTTSHAQEPAKADPKRPLTHQEVSELVKEAINKLEDMAKKAMGDDRTDCPQAPGVVKTLNNHINQLSSVLGDQTTTYSAISENNKSPIRTIADSMFDFYMCSRSTLGKRRWEKSFSEQQKKSFLVLYREMIIKRLVEQILPSLDKKPVVKGVSCGIENMVTVRFESSKGKYGIIGFRLFDRNGTWKMIDILLDTVSLSSSNRRQFGRIVTESSQESLLEKLREDLNIDKEKEKKLIESFKWPDKKKKVTTEDLIKQLGLHKDTQAVINYLQPLARTDVPKVNLIATAHIIAYILGNEPGIPSELRRSWIETRNGKPVFRLDRVGGARWGTRIPTTVQKAVRRAVNRIEFNYPIGIHVFNNPFSYDRKSIKLPDNYFLRLNSKIPSGAGSLSGEWVLDAFEGLFYVSSIYRGKSFSLEKHKKILKSHKILVATYNDNRSGGPVSYYFFWYRKVPSNWKTILADLPKGQGMENIGPPLNFAPDYIQDAKIMVQKYKSGEPVPKQTFKKKSVKEKVSTNKKIEIDNKPAEAAKHERIARNKAKDAMWRGGGGFTDSSGPSSIPNVSGPFDDLRGKDLLNAIYVQNWSAVTDINNYYSSEKIRQNKRIMGGKHWSDGFIESGFKSIDLSKVVLAVYLFNYQKQYGTCLKPDAETFEVVDHAPDISFKNVLGQEIARSYGYTIHEKFKVNKEFAPAFRKVGRMKPEGAMMTIAEFFLNQGGTDVKQQVVLGTKQMMNKYDCHSPEIIKMEQALLKVGLR